MLHRLLPVLLFVALISFLVLNFQSVKRDVLYKLHLSGDPTTSCCTPATISKTGDFDESANIAIFNNQVIDYPKTSLAAQLNQQLAEESGNTAVLGTTTANGDEKWIEVSLEEQKLRAWEGNKLVMEFPISSGLWFPTPKGTFTIWYKVRNTRMTGGSKELGTYYDLPNVPSNLFFYGGYALHGAYWHNNFGHPMSHGCVNEPLANAAQIFEWAGPTLAPDQNAVLASAQNPGTRVVIH